MNNKQMILIIALLCISVILSVVPVAVYFIRRVLEKTSGGTQKKSAVSIMLVLSACLVASVWCLRYAVGYFSLTFPENGELALTWWEEIFNSMVHALQTFSMDESYTEYIVKGKEMVSVIFGENSGWITAYGFYASVLNFAAPVAGGAILFEILAGIFPKIKLGLLYLVFRKDKYYFSELNDASLALAKSIFDANVSIIKRPVIVFADAYTDNEDENDSKRFAEAKLMGAICIRDDLPHIKKNRFGMRKFFLINKNESDNLKILAALADSANKEYLKKAEIFLFTNNNAYVQVERSVRDGLKFEEKDMPVFVPVKSYRNLISNLLVEVPLYEPLQGKNRDADGNRSLTVTLIGTGDIITEMFLSTYWFGQILDCNLKINVVSQESEYDFRSRIDYVNPEIWRTTQKDDPILRINRKGEMADIYAEINYLQCDVKSSQFISYLTDSSCGVSDTDYFFVSLDSDEDNVSVADTVRKYVGHHHIKKNEPIKTVIAYVVQNSELSEILNRKRFYSFVGDKPDVYMYAVGNVQDVYSVNNVFLSAHEQFAQKSFEAYDAIQNTEERAKNHRERMKDDYRYWANLARGMHVKYKVYSMGLMKASLFDCPDSPESYYRKQAEAYDEYKRVVAGRFEFESAEHEAAHLELLHKMSWLEHRRWCAFTRVMGFRTTTDYNVYAVPGKKDSYKQMDLKLHPCLVECDKKGIKGVISSKGIIDNSSLFRCEDTDSFDLLDDLSYDLYRRKYIDYDFKQYDYPSINV